MFIRHYPTVTFQLHNFDLFRTCYTYTVAWQLARFQLTLRIAELLVDTVACFELPYAVLLGNLGSSEIRVPPSKNLLKLWTDKNFVTARCSLQALST